MRFNKLNGQTTVVNLIKAKQTKRTKFSQYQNHVFDVLLEIFAGLNIYYEIYIDGVYLDFLIPSINLAVEVDGLQHDEFNEFFHKNGCGFLKSIKRDEKKLKICEINNITLIRIPQQDALKKELIIGRITNGLKS